MRRGIGEGKRGEKRVEGEEGRERRGWYISKKGSDEPRLIKKLHGLVSAGRGMRPTGDGRGGLKY